MDRKMKVEYIRYYSPGSEAHVLAPERRRAPKKKPAAAPKAQVKPLVISVDPLAALAIVVAVAMLVLMGVGMLRLSDARRERAEMEDHIQNLEAQNQELTQTLESGYNLDDLEKAALALGMVPMEDAPRIQVEMDPAPVEPVSQPSLLDRIFGFLKSLFA